MSNIKKEFDVAIIGGGPAGLTAAIYSQRANLTSCFIEQSAPGGKMVNTAFIENYPGFKKVEGPSLSYEMFNQALELGSEYIGDSARQIKQDGKYKLVILKSGEIIKAKTVIIAIGTINRKLDIPGEERLAGKGVSYCAICDGAFFKNENIAVIGGGNSAVEEAIYLSTIGKQVYLIVRRDQFRADPKVVEHLKTIKNIEIIYNSIPLEIKGDKKVESILIKNNINNYEREIPVAAVFPFIGLIPLSILIDDKELKKTPIGFIEVDKDMQTSIDGIYAIGDIIDKKYRQISTAINDGTIAALSCKDYISNKF